MNQSLVIVPWRIVFILNEKCNCSNWCKWLCILRTNNLLVLLASGLAVIGSKRCGEPRGRMKDGRIAPLFGLAGKIDFPSSRPSLLPLFFSSSKHLSDCFQTLLPYTFDFPFTPYTLLISSRIPNGFRAAVNLPLGNPPWFLSPAAPNLQFHLTILFSLSTPALKRWNCPWVQSQKKHFDVPVGLEVLSWLRSINTKIPTLSLYLSLLSSPALDDHPSLLDISFSELQGLQLWTLLVNF